MEVFALLVGLVIIPAVIGGVIKHRRQRVCPNCAARALRARLVDPVHQIVFFRCQRCMAEFAEQRKQGLIALDAWHRGIRSIEPLPKAQLLT